MAAPQAESSLNSPVTQHSFLSRAALPSTAPLAVSLYRLMGLKKSNLCLSADVTTTEALLDIVERVGESICMLKTHADIVDDFGERTTRGLMELARRKKFLIFEDRKFGDIGSTVQKQYLAGPLRIAQWASIVNAHIFPGPAIITALKSAATDVELPLLPLIETEITADSNSSMVEPETTEPEDTSQARRDSAAIISTTTTIETREEPPTGSAQGGAAASIQTPDAHPAHKGLLLLAEMSSEDNLLIGAYTEQCVALAREHRDFVIGFIAQRSLNREEGDNFLTLTPGVSLPPANEPSDDRRKKDGLGQQYNTPRQVVLERGSDVIIVGRGILNASDPKAEAERYRQEAWKAYEDRLARHKS